MDFLQVVESRRAVRQYRAAPLSRELIERLIGTAVLAPSARNLQPWAFAVVTDTGHIDAYPRRAREHLIASPGLLQLPATKSELGIPRHYHVVAPIVLGCPAAWPESPGRHAPEIHWLP